MIDYEQFDHIENWTPYDIMRWNAVCFPNANLENQEARVFEELGEFGDNESIAEIADALIATMGVGRFDIFKMAYLLEEEVGKAISLYREEFSIDEIQEAINEKMKINLKRWKNKEWIWDEATQQYKRPEEE